MIIIPLIAHILCLATTTQWKPNFINEKSLRNSLNIEFYCKIEAMRILNCK